MKIALAQIRAYPGELSRNAQTLVKSIERATAAGAHLVVFPEMSDTGYHMPTIVETAGTWTGGVYAEVAGAAAANQIHVIAGLSERVGKDIFNSLAVIGPDGKLLSLYRKTHLITAAPVFEHHYIKPGDRISRCEIEGFQVGLMTCYDIRFPELARRLCLSGAEVLIVPAAFPLIRQKHWEILASARAIENQVYLAAVNRVGEDKGLTFCGSSRLLDPYGDVLGSASEIDEALIVGEISKERLFQVRDRMRVFQDRREELYSGSVTEPGRINPGAF